MKNMENLPEAIFDLLASKAYQELNRDERSAVLEHFSAEEYDQYREVVGDFQSLDRSMIVSPGEQIASAEKPSLLRRILTYKLPVYQVAAAFLLFVFSTTTISNTKYNRGSNHADNPVVKVDAEGTNAGTSLANDDYPEALVINF